MLSSFNFFANVSPDVLLLMYSTLPAQELYLKCRLLDKQQSFLGTIALLEKQEQAAVAYQQRLIVDLLNSQTHPALTIITVSEAHHHRLSNTLFRLIKNPLWELTSKLGVIRLLGNLKGQALILTDATLDKIENKLKSTQCIEVYQGLELLTVLIPGFITTAKFGALLQAVQSNLADDDREVRAAALQCLARLMPHISLDAVEVSALLQVVQSNLVDNDWRMRAVARECLVVLIPYVLPGEVSVLLQAAQSNLADNNWIVRAAALQCLAVLMPHISPGEVSALLQAIQLKLADDDRRVIAAALDCLVGFMPHHVSLSDASVLLQAIQLSLANDDRDIRAAALTSLAVLIPHVSPGEASALLQAVLLNLADNDREVQEVAGRCLITMVSKLTDAEQNKFIQENGTSLVDAHSKLFYQLINALLSQAEKKDDLKLLQQASESDLLLQIFITNYKVLLNEQQLPSDSLQPNL